MGIRRWLLRAVLATIAFPLSVHASLGGNSTSIQDDGSRMAASVQTVPASQYTQFDLQLPSGSTVREYLSPGGTVFAVTWEGPSLPDLRQILGGYFQRYVDSSQGGGPGARAIQQSDFVVYTGGRMRAFRGRAYVPQLVPSGVGAENLP